MVDEYSEPIVTIRLTASTTSIKPIAPNQAKRGVMGGQPTSKGTSAMVARMLGLKIARPRSSNSSSRFAKVAMSPSKQAHGQTHAVRVATPSALAPAPPLGILKRNAAELTDGPRPSKRQRFVSPPLTDAEQQRRETSEVVSGAMVAITETKTAFDADEASLNVRPLPLGQRAAPLHSAVPPTTLSAAKLFPVSAPAIVVTTPSVPSPATVTTPEAISTASSATLRHPAHTPLRLPGEPVAPSILHTGRSSPPLAPIPIESSLKAIQAQLDELKSKKNKYKSLAQRYQVDAERLASQVEAGNRAFQHDMNIKQSELADRDRMLRQAERDKEEMRAELQEARSVRDELERCRKRCRELEGQVGAWKERWAGL